MDIILGTANFGAVYGISNKKKISLNDLKKIIKICEKNSIEFIDTSYNYKNSEKIISKLCRKKNYKIITKLPLINGSFKKIEKKFNQSLKRLNKNQIYGLLTHNPKDLKLDNFKKIYKILNDLKKAKKIKKIGISIYKPSELIKIASRFKIDIVEIPMSIFDQRFCEKKILNFIKKKNIQIYCRSIFLQGLVFLNNNLIKKKFKGEINKIIKFKKLLNNDKFKILQHCIHFIKKKKIINKIVIGINSPVQLNEIIKVYKKSNKIIKLNYNDYSIKDNKIILPYKWKN
jgi:aryl-alcohol dehydrogenase-like predicted oxidoreductase